MGAIHKLSEESLLKTCALPNQRTKDITWRKQLITVKERLPLQEYLNIVNHILRDCKSEDGQLAFEIVDFALRLNVIGAYTFIDLPKDINKLYDIIYFTDLYDAIAQEISQIQLNNIIETIFNYTGIRGGQRESSGGR